MTKYANVRLTSEGRAALRKAITNHAGWTSAYRNKRGLSLASMSREDFFNVADDLGINVLDTIAVAASERATEAAEVFPDDAKEIVKKAPGAPRNAPADADTGAKLAALIASLASSTVSIEQVEEIVGDAVASALKNFDFNSPVTRIELTSEGVKVGEIDGHAHPEFAKLLRAASARDASGYAPNVWIAGPAGSGKTYAVGQVARAMGVEFHYNGAIGMSHELLGFVDAGGTYHRTAFRDAYEHGGCYLFDEVDGSDNAALLALNAALANGSATFPDKVVKRHKECRIFAAANTWGYGATADYVGRSKLDAAFLSRFPVRITWNYDEALEQNICGNAEFARVVQKARAAAKNAGIKVLITPRDSMAGAALVAAGFTITEAAEMTFLASLSAEQRLIISRNS